MRTSFSIPPPPPPAEQARRARLPDRAAERAGAQRPAQARCARRVRTLRSAHCAGADVLNFSGFPP